MAISTEVIPSPHARHIYGMMVKRATPVEDAGDDLHLSLARTIELSAVLQRQGEDAQASTAVAELRQADWITPVGDGGWLIS